MLHALEHLVLHEQTNVRGPSSLLPGIALNNKTHSLLSLYILYYDSRIKV